MGPNQLVQVLPSILAVVVIQKDSSPLENMAKRKASRESSQEPETTAFKNDCSRWYSLGFDHTCHLEFLGQKNLWDWIGLVISVFIFYTIFYLYSILYAMFYPSIPLWRLDRRADWCAKMLLNTSFFTCFFLQPCLVAGVYGQPGLTDLKSARSELDSYDYLGSAEINMSNKTLRNKIKNRNTQT